MRAVEWFASQRDPWLLALGVGLVLLGIGMALGGGA